MTTAEITLTLVGGPTVLIEFDGIRLLTDASAGAAGLYDECRRRAPGR